MSTNGKRNGWGILYDGPFIVIGWFKDDANHGNSMILNGKSWAVMDEGWYDMGDKEGPQKEDGKYKLFKLEDVILNLKGD